MAKAIENRVADLIGQTLEEAGYDLVRVQMKGGGKYATLQIMAERRDGVGMTVEDCATISKVISPTIEAEADLAGKYDLEVSSPGIDRPLVKLQDYVHYEGHVAKVETNAPVKGQRRFQGKIAGVDGDAVKLSTDKGIVELPFGAIEQAKLVLTDELLKAELSKN